jgi:membrane protein
VTTLTGPSAARRNSGFGAGGLRRSDGTRSVAACSRVRRDTDPRRAASSWIGVGGTMLEIIKQTVKQYGDDNAPLLAAALAYFSVFSLAPLLIIMIAVLVFLGAGDAQETVLGIVRDAVGAEGAEMVETMIEAQEEGGGGIVATIVGIVVLLFAATTLFAQLKRALNIIWGTEPEPEGRLGGVKALVMTRVKSLGLIVAIGLLLLIAFFLTTVVSAAVSAAGAALPGGAAVWLWLNRLVAFAALVVVFVIVFRFLPNAQVPWRPIWIGSTVTALLFVIASWLFGIYISNVAVASAYGAAGSLVVLLLWVFFSSQIVLLGGELTQVLSRRAPGDDGIRRPSTT